MKGNRNNRQRDDYKQDKPTRTSGITVVEDASSATLMQNPAEVVVTNSKLVKPGVLSNSTEVRFRYIGITVEQLTEQIDAETDALLDSVIRGYSNSLGYTSTTTPEQLRDLVKASIQYVAHLLHFQRSQNCYRVIDQQGRAFGEALSTAPINNLASSVATYLTASGPYSPTFQSWGSVGISNAVYAKDYLSKLVYARVPDSIFDMLHTLFTKFYRINPENAVDSVVTFVPFTEQVASVQSTLDDYAGLLYAAATATPDILQIADLLEFNGSKTRAWDYTRDIKALTAVIVQDEFMNSLIINSGAAYFGIPTTSDSSHLVFLPENTSTFFGFKDQEVIPADYAWLINILRDATVTSAFHAMRGFNEGSTTASTYPNVGFVVAVDTSGSLSLANYATILYEARIFGAEPPYLYAIDLVSTSTYTFIPSNYFVEDNATFVLPETFDYYYNTRSAILLFNNKFQYRTWLQEYAASFRRQQVSMQN